MSQKLVNGKMVASEEASQDFVDFWRLNVNPEYKSPYPGEAGRRMRRLQAYYFPNFQSNLIAQKGDSPITKEQRQKIDTSFIGMYEKD